MEVTGNPAREFIGQTPGFIEVADMQTVRTTHHGSHRFAGGTEHIVIDIVAGLRPRRSAHVQMDALGLFIPIEGSDNPCPEHAHRPESGYFQKEVCANRAGELHARRDLVDIQAALLHGPQIRHPGRQGTTHLLPDTGTAVVVDIRADHDSAQVRRICHCPARPLGQQVVAPFERCR